MTVREVAEDHYRDRAVLTSAVSSEASARWREVRPADVLSTWAAQQDDLLLAVTGAQFAAAQTADRYVAEALSEQAVRASAGATVQPQAFAGQASDGRPLDSLLLRPAVATEALLLTGVPETDALATGLAALDMIVRTQVADAGRYADQVATVTRPAAGGFTRVTVGETCARCAVLAGRWYRWSDDFRRHPRCDCQMVPGRDEADSVYTNPDALVRAGLVRGLSEKDLEAIRLGADLSQVVNAQRGVYSAWGGRQFTRAGTTRRGIAGARILAREIDRAEGQDVRVRTYTNVSIDKYDPRLQGLLERGRQFTRSTASGREQRYAYSYTRAPRPTPGQIIDAAESRDEALRLLTNNGYIIR